MWNPDTGVVYGILQTLEKKYGFIMNRREAAMDLEVIDQGLLGRTNSLTKFAPLLKCLASVLPIKNWYAWHKRITQSIRL